MTRLGVGLAAAIGVCLAVAIGVGSAWMLRPASSSSQACSIQLHDATDDTGIDFHHTDGGSGRHYIVETVTSGVALFDYDGDGLIDIYFPNGAPLPGTKLETTPRHALYRNLGNFQFVDVAKQAGLGCTEYGLGVTVADYDNDGWPDLFLSNYGRKVLCRNNGGGTFTDVTKTAGVDDGNRVGAGAAFLDIDGDGFLDIYAANYVQFLPEKNITSMRNGFMEYTGPKSYAPEEHSLFRNRGDGTFRNVSVEAGIAGHPGPGMGIVCADYDNDGHTDVFVLNDVGANFLWKNDGTGKFRETALSAGFAYNGLGEVLGNMGIDCADYDNDGRLDFFSTSYQNQLPVLFHNLGDGAFEDATAASGAGAGSYANVKWGCGFVDFDNDGRRDLFIAMGHLQDQIERYDGTTAFRARNVLVKNMGGGKFIDVTGQAGDGMLPVFSSRGVAFEDLDNDGDVDVVIQNSRDKPTILRNMLYESGSSAHWLAVRLQGVKTNRDGVGARVRVVAGDLVQIDEVHAGRGYQSYWGSRLHFGLGDHDTIDRIEVRWIGGGVDVFDNIPVNRLVTLTEGDGRDSKDQTLPSAGQ